MLSHGNKFTTIEEETHVENMFQFILIFDMNQCINKYIRVCVCVYVHMWGWFSQQWIPKKRTHFEFVRQVIVKSWIRFGHLTGAAVTAKQ